MWQQAREKRKEDEGREGERKSDPWVSDLFSDKVLGPHLLPPTCIWGPLKGVNQGQQWRGLCVAEMCGGGIWAPSSWWLVRWAATP